MKKFLVGLMSIFLLIGGGLLSACNTGKGTINLDSQSVEIELNGGEGSAQITAIVSGGKDSRVNVSWNGYENIIEASVSTTSSGKNIITIKGLTEHENAELVVSASGCESKIVNVTVYSYVSSMNQKVETGDKKQNYLVRGETTTLDDTKLLDLNPNIKSRRDINWSLVNDNDNVTIDNDNNSITIGQNFEGDYILLKATNLLKSDSQTDEVSCEVTLPVLDNLKALSVDDIKINVGYEAVGELDENTTYDVISNANETNSHSQLNALITYNGNLKVEPIISSTDGKLDTGMLRVVENGKSADNYLQFSIHSNEDYKSLNGEFDVKFKIGYEGFDYAVELGQKIHVKIREVINEVVLADREGASITSETTKSIYTRYALGAYGDMVRVSLKPTKVVDADYTYTLRVAIPNPNTQMANFANFEDNNFSPLTIKYKDKTNVLQELMLHNAKDDNGAPINGVYEINNLSADIIYLVSADLKDGVEKIEGVEITVTSDDEPSATASYNAVLARAISNFDGALSVYDSGTETTSTNAKDFAFALNSDKIDTTYKKQFKLVGQGSLSGLHVKSNSNFVLIEDKLVLKKVGEEGGKPYIVFEVSASLNGSAYGETLESTYEFYHDNGTNVSDDLKEKLKLDVFLPLTDASLMQDAKSNSNSVVNAKYSKEDLRDGDSYSSSLTSIILKNNSLTPISAVFNKTTNGKEANPTVKVSFVDLTEDNENLNLTSSDLLEGLTNKTLESKPASDYVDITIENNIVKSIKTKNVGKTYAIFTFTGKAEKGEGKTIQRIVKIESLISVDGLSLSQEKDRNITLYAGDTIADEDINQTKKTIRVYFANSNITYADLTTNFVFNSATNENSKYFKVENKKLGSNYIDFDVVALTTGDNAIFNGDLEMHYQVYAEEKIVIDIWTTLNITILNAQRVESVTWVNESTDGLEFNVGDTSGQYLVFDVSPTNAKNSGLKYLPIDKDGNAQTGNSFVKISEISSSQIGVTVNSATKVKGSLIVYPADMVHSGNIRYYYKIGGEENYDSISLTQLGQIKEDKQTWFDYLTSQAYFVSYKIGETDNGQPQKTEISFAKILKKIDIIVVDGSSFEYAYSLYSADDFKTVENDKYYTLKNNIELTAESQIEEFVGGLQGKDRSVSITFNIGSFNLVETLKGTIRNLTLIGNVSGDGFVCDINDGTIENVTIDTNGTYASMLTTTGIYGGGIVGINNGTIKNVSVLGLSIEGNSSYIGGVAGKNSGSIYGAKVEFYNVQTGKDETGAKTYATNQFKGSTESTNVIAGLVGEAVKGSTIERCYAYDYTLESGTNGKKNTLTAPFIGIVSGTDGNKPEIIYSFAVVGCESKAIADAFPKNVTTNVTYVTYKDVYNSYYDGETYISVNEITDANSFVGSGENGYKAYVNGGNGHLKDFYQDEKLSAVNLNSKDIKTNNGYMQVMVTDDKQMIFMHYGLDNIVETLTETEQRDLDRLNTISLSELAGNDGVKVTSSDERVVKVQGTNLFVNQTGSVTLTFSSRQDASNYIEKEITVISAYNGFKLSYGSIEDVDSTKISIQKTKSANLTASLLKTDVYLGSLAKNYALKTSSFKLEITSEPSSEKNGVILNKSGLVFTAVTNNNSVETTVNLQAKVAGEEFEHSSLKKSFTISPEEGAISINFTSEKFVITPSINEALKVVVKTTQKNDNIIPTIIYKNSSGDIVLTRTGDGVYVFSRNNTNILTVSVVKDESLPAGENDNLITDTYTVTFSIHEDYKKAVRADEKFEVYFTTTTQNESEKFELEVNRQKFTSIDITNSVVKNAYRNDGKDIYVAGEKTSTLAPGKSSIMQVSVNPEFAYYDYMEIRYSGVNIAGAVTIDRLQKSGENYSSVNTQNFEQIGNAFRYTPSAEEKTQQIYFKLWINTTVEADSTLCFTISFHDANGTELTYANYYMDISYLREPRITIDGEDTVFLAKGSSSQIKIEVLSNQTLDALVVDGNVNGISIESVSDEPELDLTRGVKTYTATIRASLKAKVNENSTGTFYLKATVRRTLNGFEETKYAIATVILVDFKINEDNILIGEKKGDSQELTVWAGVPKTVKINYGFIPEEYPIGEAGSEEAQAIINARNKFSNEGYYYSGDKVNDSNYIINYRDKSTDKNTKDYQKLSIKERLFYVIGGEEYSLDGENLSSKAITVYESPDKNLITITGNVMSGTSVSMVLYTYITANNIEKMIKTYFTIKIETFADEDLPLVIKDADEFRALDPENGEKDAQDYILLNDIVLENYTPFDTTYISSLDGNGYTIYIKSFAMKEDESTLNFALFNNVVKTTMLKNVRVNLYEGGQLTVNISQYKNINVAGFALSNKGIITNCEVVAFYTNGSYTVGGQKLAYTNRLPSNKQAGINLFLTNGINTTQEAHLADNLKVSVSLAGFVLNNDGNITNSRVGGDSIYVISGEETTSDGLNIGRTDAEQVELEDFIISGQGCMAGFVQNNSGTISASFVKNVGIDNRSNISKDLNGQDVYLAGFVGENSGRIVTSFVEGIRLAESENETAIMGSSLKSQGIIAGFAYSNISQINDSYSNILISSSQGQGNVMFASGFVYKNSGKIVNGFSACQIESDKFTQMNFSGVDANSESQQTGEYENCYFYSVNNGSAENDSSATTETQYSTGAMLIADPTIVESFYGFAISISADDDGGIWRIIDGKVSLIEAERISFSHRYIYYVEDSTYEGATRVDGDKKYILPYTTLVIGGTTIDTSLGGVTNPIIIADAEDFVNAMGESSSTYIKKYFDESNIYGTYRVVNDIDFNDLTTETASYSLPSSSRSFSGRFYGNGFTINSIRLTSSNKNVVSYGLFKSLESISKTSAEIGTGKVFKPIVTNLILKVDGVVAGDVPLVGVLAGYVKDATMVSITIDFSSSAEIVGYNFVGGIAGYAFGSTVVKNVTINNPSTYALYYTSTGAQNLIPSTISNFRAQASLIQNGTTFDNIIVSEFRKYSYAGALFGMADIRETAQSNFDYVEYQKSNYQINNIKVRGIVKSKAMVVGGAIGLTGAQTYVNDISVVFDGSSSVNESKLYAMFGYAGGVIGQAFGGVTRIYAEHTKEIQDNIESNMHAYYSGNTTVERGILNLFVGDEDYTQKAIGGLIGFAGSGALEVSYSKINVTSPKAKYAGGVIGEVQSLEKYSAEAKIVGKFTTSYLVHEVYATGDVRASVKGGGIVGKTTGGTLSFLSVNAYNYFTSYDYEKGENVTLKSEANNSLTPNYKINTFVGEVYSNSTANNALSKDNIENFKQYVDFIKAESASSSDGDATKPTVSYYARYNFAGTDFSVNLMDGIGGGEYTENADRVYVIEGPASFTTTESTHTQEGFLKSEVWLEENWKHATSDLFPKIQYRTYGGVIYLDCYNVAQVFSQMRYNDITVIVRGKTAPGSNTYADIDLTESRYRNIKAVEGFYGTIIGGMYLTTKDGSDVKIVSNRNFISSTKEGFAVKSLTVRFENSSTDQRVLEINANNKSDLGLFIDGNLTSARINGLTIQLGSGVSIKNVSGNVGIVASSIINTSISNLKLEADKELGQVLLSVDENSEIANIGLIAGKLIQNSEYSVMTVSNVAVDANNNSLITVAGTVSESVGGMFGTIRKEEKGLYLKVSNINANLNVGDETNKNNIQVTKIVAKERAYLGGVVGLIEKVDEFSIDEATENICSYAKIDSLSSTLYAGGVIGKVSNVTNWGTKSFNGISGSLNIGKIDEKDISIYAGGFAGNIAISGSTIFDLTVNGSSYKIEVPSGNDAGNKTIKDAYIGGLVGFNGGVDEAEIDGVKVSGAITISNVGENVGVSGNVTVTDTASVGGLIGLSKAEVTINTKKQIKDNTKILRMTANSNATLNYGGLVGEVQGEFSLTANAGATLTNSVSVEASGDTSSANVGGIVGKAEGSVTINDGAEGTEQLIRYDGQVKSNIKSIAFGGMVGRHEKTNSTDDTNNAGIKFTSTYTSFGGALTITGENSNSATVYAGGVVGYVNVSNPAISYSYNYGDVFVDYDNSGITSLSEYYFGGLVGLHDSGSTTGNVVKAEYNFTLMTSHNSRYSTATENTAHALVGGGTLDTSATNYYNHKVCLLTDDQGTDAGYTVEYDIDGYSGYNDSTKMGALIKNIADAVGGTFDKGTKLNPSTSNEVAGTQFKFTGWTEESVDGTISYQATGTAYIYESNEAIDFKNNENTRYGYFNSLKGFDFVSGFIVENNRVIENATPYDPDKNTSYGGLVGKGTINTIIYASQVRGTIEVGGIRRVAVAGLVGTTSGKIFDSSTDINILYRAGINGSVRGSVSGLVGQGYTGGFIENCHTGGKITTYISANCYAIGEAINNSSPLLSTTYQNCYSYTHFDLNEYVNGSFEGETYLIGGENIHDNIFYDKNACERELNGTSYGTNLHVGESDDDNKGKLCHYNNDNIEQSYVAFNNWTADYRYNYGYPTLKYGYLKNSSFAYVASSADIKQQSSSTTTNDDSSTDITYDSYVFDITYTARPNGYSEATTKDKWQGDNNYYMIPNATVWDKVFKDSNINQSNINNFNYILTNDIDLNPTSFNGSLSSKDKIFSGVLDGQGYTIKGLKTSLFGSVSGNTSAPTGQTTSLTMQYDSDSDGGITIKETCTGGGTTFTSGIVLNLRLTDAMINNSNEEGSKYYGLLANEITNAFVSNMTLSGQISVGFEHDESGNITKGKGIESVVSIGGLASFMNGGHIACVTNLVMVNARTSPQNNKRGENRNVHAGGIIGAMSDRGGNKTRISYCSNYGPINASTEWLNDATTEFYSDIIAGGIVGYIDNTSTPEIEYSYNATSVLSGYAIPGATSLECANCAYYAAGIVGRAGTAIAITNCYNSGIIKAGNKSQTAGAYAAGIIADGSGNATVTKCYNEGSIEALGKNPEWKITKQSNSNKGIVLSETSSRNVYAYGITNGKSTDCKINTSYNSINNNGALGRRNNIAIGSIYSTTWAQETEGAVGGENIFESSVGTYKDWLSATDHIDEDPLKSGNPLKSTVTVKRNEKLSNECKFDVLASNKYGLPTRVVCLTQTSVTINIYRDENEYDKDYGYGYKAQAETRKEYNDQCDVELTYDYVAGYDNKISSENKTEDSTWLFSKSDFRSQQTGTSPVDKTINGASYNFVNSNNVYTAFEGIYYPCETVEQPLDLPYVDGDYYTVTITGKKANNKEITGEALNGISITEGANGKAVISFTPVFYEQITSYSYTVALNYKQSLEVDTSAWEYVYIDNISIGLTGVEQKVIDAMQSQGSIAIGDVTYNDSYILTDESDKQYYFAYDNTNKLLVYIPNAKLSNGNIVNEYDKVFSANDHNMVNEIISLFKNKTFSMKLEQKLMQTYDKTSYIPEILNEIDKLAVTKPDNNSISILLNNPAGKSLVCFYNETFVGSGSYSLVDDVYIWKWEFEGIKAEGNANEIKITTSSDEETESVFNMINSKDFQFYTSNLYQIGKHNNEKWKACNVTYTEMHVNGYSFSKKVTTKEITDKNGDISGYELTITLTTNGYDGVIDIYINGSIGEIYKTSDGTWKVHLDPVPAAGFWGKTFDCNTTTNGLQFTISFNISSDDDKIRDLLAKSSFYMRSVSIKFIDHKESDSQKKTMLCYNDDGKLLGYYTNLYNKWIWLDSEVHAYENDSNYTGIYYRATKYNTYDLHIVECPEMDFANNYNLPFKNYKYNENYLTDIDDGEINSCEKYLGESGNTHYLLPVSIQMDEGSYIFEKEGYKLHKNDNGELCIYGDRINEAVATYLIAVNNEEVDIETARTTFMETLKEIEKEISSGLYVKCSPAISKDETGNYVVTASLDGTTYTITGNVFDQTMKVQDEGGNNVDIDIIRITKETDTDNNEKYYLYIKSGTTISSVELEENSKDTMSIGFGDYEQIVMTYPKNLTPSYSVVKGLTPTSGELVIYLKDNNLTEFTIEVVENSSKNIDKSEKPEATTGSEKNIVLTKDIILDNGKSIQNKNAGVSIYGNGYYISIYGGPFYAKINNGKSDKFQDLILLGESNGKLLPSVSNLELENVKLYGVAQGLCSYSSRTNNSITSYACLTNSYNNIIVSGENVSVTNYGTIVSADGKDATIWSNATSGKSITFGSTSTNYGVVKAGNGGNGWTRTKTLTGMPSVKSYEYVSNEGKEKVRNIQVGKSYDDSCIKAKGANGSLNRIADNKGIKENINIDYNIKEPIFDLGLLLLGRRYDTGKDYTFAEPALIVYTAQGLQESLTRTLPRWGSAQNKWLYVDSKENETLIYSASIAAAGGNDAGFVVVHKDKDSDPRKCFDIQEWVFNTLVSQGTANLGKSFGTTY